MCAIDIADCVSWRRNLSSQSNDRIRVVVKIVSGSVLGSVSSFYALHCKEFLKFSHILTSNMHIAVTVPARNSKCLSQLGNISNQRFSASKKHFSISCNLTTSVALIHMVGTGLSIKALPILQHITPSRNVTQSLASSMLMKVQMNQPLDRAPADSEGSAA